MSMSYEWSYGDILEAVEQITPDEQLALTIHAVAGMRLFESYHTQHLAGVFTAQDWSAMRNVIKAHFAFSIFRSVFRGDEGIWNPDFAEELRKIIAEIESSYWVPVHP